MAHTPFLQIVPQRHSSDCAVACLAMLLGVSYEAALLAMRKPQAMTCGVKVRDILAAARRLKRPLRFRRKFDLETDTGIVGLRAAKWPSEHVAILKEGLIVDTDATIWETDCFLAAYDAKAISLLTLQDN